MPHDHDEREFQPDEEESLGAYGIAEIAVRELLLEKGIFTAEEFRRSLEGFDRAAPERGAKVVARAWSDAEYKSRLLDDATAAIAEMGYEGRQGEHMVVVENTAHVHNLVVCTLCSCYPWPVLGLPPVWYKSAPYRSRAVSEPRSVLAEFGTTLDPEVRIQVWDSTSEMRYLVLPERPDGTEGWSVDELERLASRNSMIGVEKAASPEEST